MKLQRLRLYNNGGYVPSENVKFPVDVLGYYSQTCGLFWITASELKRVGYTGPFIHLYRHDLEFPFSPGHECKIIQKVTI